MIAINTQNYGFFLQLGHGAWVTLTLAFCALPIGLSLGLLGMLAENSRVRLLRWMSITLTSSIRGVPELLVIFLIYFGGTTLLATLAGKYVDFSAFTAGIIALGLLFGSYASQVFRGAFLAVPIGQTESGIALGFNHFQIFFHIQLPQAWRHALPGLGNLWLVLLKDTALVSLIGVADLMNRAQTAASTTHKAFTFYLTASALYLLITSVSQIILNKINHHANQYLKS